MKFSTPYCGYAPGQKIHFVLYINNESSIDITECEVKLKQEVSYESHDPQHEYRYDKHLIALKQFGNVLRWSRKVYRGYLDLPSIPPTSVKPTCPISVNYSIKIIVNPTEFHWKVKLKIPLTIGSIPIMDGPEALLRFNRQQQQHQVVSQNFQMSTQQNQRQRDRNSVPGSRRLSSNSSTSSTTNNNNNSNNHGAQSAQRATGESATLPTNTSPSATPTTAAPRPLAMPAILVTSDSDNPPDYIPMSKLPPLIYTYKYIHDFLLISISNLYLVSFFAFTVPPSYEDAMALSEKFSDDIEFLTNVSMSSIMSAQGDVTSEREPFKPRYPVYYDYETPTIPPGSDDSTESDT